MNTTVYSACPHHKNICCEKDARQCGRCGWNPKEEDRRKRLIRTYCWRACREIMRAEQNAAEERRA